jgi:hypothetical protein
MNRNFDPDRVPESVRTLLDIAVANQVFCGYTLSETYYGQGVTFLGHGGRMGAPIRAKDAVIFVGKAIRNQPAAVFRNAIIERHNLLDALSRAVEDLELPWYSYVQ